MGAPILLCDGFDLRRLQIEKSNGDESSKATTEEEDDTLFAGEEEEEEEEEWSGENSFCFYLVKQRAYDDPEIKAKIDEADNEIYRCNNDRIHIANILKAKRAERLSLVAPIENLISSLDEYNSMFSHQSMAMEINKEQEVVTEEINSLSERLSEIKMEMELLDAQMACVLDQRDKAFERIKILRLQRDKGNAAFFQSRVVMKKAIDLAASGNVRDLEELANSEVDKFMSRWNTDKAFRDDYEKRILPSLDEQVQRRDGRNRSPEGDVATTENGNETAEKKAIKLDRFSTEEESDDVMDFYIPVYEKLQKEEEEIDEETLKEKKREEQLEKTRLAMERKRKLHEKAAAKAAIRVKKEAEKKVKELEKRAKKKMASFNSSSPSDLERTADTVTEASELEKTGKEKAVNGRSVFPKQRSFKYRHHGKGNEAVPKAIMKRRKAYRLWVWTVSSTAVALPLALLVAFFYIR